MLNNFNSVVLQVATLILIVLLIIIGIAMYYSAKNAEYPPVVGECPDYWNVTRKGDKTTCTNVLKINPNSVSQTDSCNNVDPVNFKGLTDVDTICNKYKWATNCGIVWDGITNNNASCIR